MAMIPNKVKVKRSADGGMSTELVVAMVAVVLLIDRVLSERVHSKLSWVVLIVCLVVFAYALLPSSLNYGNIGYERFLNFGKYYLAKIRRKGYGK